jgi:CubicO group peptidase (beta-lactamase class C family)
MTRRQTPEHEKTAYGLGWQLRDKTYGHGGALGTDMTVDPARGIATIYLIQHIGFAGEGNQALPAFRKAAAAKYGK